MPHFEHYSAQFPNVTFAILESTEGNNDKMLEQWKELAGPNFSIRGFPTLVLYDGEGNPVRVVENRFALDEEIKK